jgi:hypothetical protein
MAENKRSKAYPAPSAEKMRGDQIVPVTKRHAVIVEPQNAGKLSKAEKKAESLRSIEDGLLERSMKIMAHTLDFASIPFDMTEPDEAFRAKHGKDADEAFRIMKAAQMSAKDAPVGLLLSQRTQASIIKARSTDKVKPSGLNIAVQVVMNAPVYEEMDVES